MSNCSMESSGLKTMLTSGMIVTSVLLLGIIVVVLLGNSLVIIAVIKTRKLRTVTNIYIVSLACSDLLLGICVLPYSASYEVLGFWPFGRTWCSMWLAIDVLLCTASILNLCAISLDRFLAVTNPMKYPSLMSKRRGRVLVSCVWILSLIISLPPLIGWNDENMTMHESDEKDSRHQTLRNLSYAILSPDMVTTLNGSSSEKTCHSDVSQCLLTSTRGYRIYASMGSFYIPSLVMIFFYCKIYLTAVRTASSLKSGILVSKNVQQFKNDTEIESEVITLRIHRGGARLSTSKPYDENTPQTCYPDLLPTNGNQSEKKRKRKRLSEYESTNGGIIYEGYSSKSFQEEEVALNEHKDREKDGCFPCTRCGTGHNNTKPSSGESPYMTRKNDSNANKTGNARSMIVICNGRTSQKKHMRKFLRETRAAKTVAIIIGAFILCWLPFFIIYLVGAFCPNCTPPLVFSILFWLGYCNSMLNPFIYGLFSRDFRFAFKRLLFCKMNKNVSVISGKKEACYKMRHQLEIQILESESLSDY
ncbi:hypothetical protein FSP39_007360 [Pinctada imbricata]|uniref:G-protein coupled receptors family 1 profile domain-containing protein n=1 Tax=Pinctada imbricata TaxID=66713 RepID=A0AA88YBH1_PINIB|nr:hypothetical protein FSP39_007360 [Pinctada imbricata]